MKKLSLSIVIASLFALTACGEKKPEAAGADAAKAALGDVAKAADGAAAVATDAAKAADPAKPAEAAAGGEKKESGW